MRARVCVCVRVFVCMCVFVSDYVCAVNVHRIIWYIICVVLIVIATYYYHTLVTDRLNYFNN